VSKPRAAIWALRKLPEGFHAAIRQAITAETDEDIGDIPLETITGMLDHADRVLFNPNKIHARHVVGNL